VLKYLMKLFLLHR